MIIRSSCEEEEMDLPSYSIRLLSNAPSANAGSSRRSEAIFPLQKVPFLMVSCVVPCFIYCCCWIIQHLLLPLPFNIFWLLLLLLRKEAKIEECTVHGAYTECTTGPLKPTHTSSRHLCSPAAAVRFCVKNGSKDDCSRLSSPLL